MGLFKKKGRYNGPVVFAAGVHYPVGKDGSPNKRQGLRWDGEGYVWAADSDPSHEHVYHQQHADLEPEG